VFSVLLAAASAAPKAVAPAVQATLAPVIFDTTPHSFLAQHVPWLTHTFGGLFAVLGVLLVVLLALQTTKQEGLSGTVGGRVESTTRRLGLDAQIARVTQTVAIAFVIVATIVSLSGI
jgi:protein translocase SecG subunit